MVQIHLKNTKSSYYHTHEISKYISISNPKSNEDITIWKTNTDITIKTIDGVVVGSSPSVTWYLKHNTNRSLTGSTITGGTLINTTNGTSYSANTLINSGNWIWLETSATGGTIDCFNLTINYE